MKTSAEVDLTAFEELSHDVKRAAVEAVRGGTKRAAEVEREEVGSERLGKGIQPEYELDGEPIEGRVVAEYFDRTPPGAGVLHLPSGRTKPVPLRGSFGDQNVLLLLATGTGVYGPHGVSIRPRESRVLLIEVDAPPADEAYVTGRGKTYVLRPRSKGRRPDDFVNRAADRVEAEIGEIVGAAFAAEGL
jgi:hypothetical protein